MKLQFTTTGRTYADDVDQLDRQHAQEFADVPDAGPFKEVIRAAFRALNPDASHLLDNYFDVELLDEVPTDVHELIFEPGQPSTFNPVEYKKSLSLTINARGAVPVAATPEPAPLDPQELARNLQKQASDADAVAQQAEQLGSPIASDLRQQADQLASDAADAVAAVPSADASAEAAV